MCTWHEIWTDGGRSLRDQGGVWSKITADMNSLSGFFKGHLRTPSNSNTKHKVRDSFGCWERLGDAGNNSFCAH